MLFTSYKFIFFLIALFIIYYSVKPKYQWIVLLVFSYVFYAFAGIKYITYILLSTIVIYTVGVIIGNISQKQKNYLMVNKDVLSKEEKKKFKAASKKKQKMWLLAALIINLGVLISVKYLNFFIMNTNSIMHLLNPDMKAVSYVNIIMPLGISFYTLQAIGYIVDVYRNIIPAEKNFFKLALFISFFPQVVQGPISRYNDLSKTLYGGDSFNYHKFVSGIQRVLWGFFKKLVIADCIAPAVNTIIKDYVNYNGGYILALIFMYTIELYADFTGGIDITIGISESLGITVSENFNRPFFSKSLKEYWRRWHITMCEWFRNYVFFSISSSHFIKKITKFSKNHFGDYIGKRFPVYIASFVTWFATGIWHGANWNFIVWGLINWLILMISEELEPLYEKFHKKSNFSNGLLYTVFEILRTFLLVSCLNLFDCYATLKETFNAFLSIFTVHNWNIFVDGSMLNIGIKITDYMVIAIGVLIMLMVSLFQRKGSVREQISVKRYPVKLVIWALLVVCIVIFGTYGIGYDGSQFIYNRF